MRKPLNFKTRLLLGPVLLLAGIAAVYSAIAFNPAAQPYGYAPPLAISGFDLSRGDQTVFQTWFDPNVWRGDVVAYPVDSAGRTNASDRLWNASERLKLQDWDSGRRIVTRNSAANVAFRWADLSAAQQASIGDAATGEKILNFVRGDRSNEKEYTEEAGDGTVTVLSGSATGTLRARASVLGDIIHGKPLYVGAPPSGHLFDGYPAFKSANTGRAGAVYVGANDGMLHAFSAATGDEVFAYIPSMLVGGLKALAVDPYDHAYFVDGGLTASDAYFGSGGASGWKTVLVGGLGAGGKGLFALDVSSPAAVDESAAKAKILWEITPASAGFGDLGNTYGDPIIVRLNTGKWAAIVGNGYNNAGTGHSVLYVIDIATGVLVKALDTGSGTVASPGGLSSPSPVDTNADGKVDFVYAGDIDGKVWKFDLRNTSAAAWSSTLLFDAPQPVVGAPDVSGHPLGGFIVHFATGSLFTATQADDKTVQNHAYGIWDGAPAANLAILDQALTEARYGDQRVRVSSGLPINWNDATDVGNKPLHKGWRTTLPPGEHVLGTGFVRDGRYHFTSTNASVVNAALPNGENWLMELDYLTGATGGAPIFDLSRDGIISDADRVKNNAGLPIAGPAGIPVGVYLGSGLYSQPLMALISAKLSTTLFNRNPLSPGDKPDDPPPPATPDVGISSGHFDYDVYHGANMASFKHTHRYDDKYNVVGANFLNASDPTYNLVNTGIGGNRVTSSSRFFVLVSNGDLSPGVTLTVGGADYKAYQYPNKFDGTQPVYTSTTVPLFNFRMPTNAFTSKDWGTGVVRAGLMPTQTGCVKSAVPRPGLEGEVHNGALTIWIVKAGAPASAIALNVPGKPERGYKVIDDAWVLKKYTVFWHYGGSCYGAPGWIPNPVPDNDAASNGIGQQPAPGSQDPNAGSVSVGYGSATGAPTATSTTTTFSPSSTYNGTSDRSGTRTTTTNFSDGSKAVSTQTLDRKGRVKSTTVSIVPAAGGSSGTGGSPVTAKPTKPPATGTGYNQSRQGGKVGRIAWHELIKE